MAFETWIFGIIATIGISSFLFEYWDELEIIDEELDEDEDYKPKPKKRKPRVRPEPIEYVLVPKQFELDGPPRVTKIKSNGKWVDRVE